MPKFRQKSSSRREPKPTASWLVLGITAARLVAHGQKTTHIIPVKSRDHRKKYSAGQRLSVRAFVGGPTEAHIHITSVQRVPAGSIDFHTVRELGHPYLDAFKLAWIREHDEPWWRGVQERLGYALPDEETFLEFMERFERRHAHRDVWVLRFALDRMLPVRFLAQNSEEGYTDNPARGLKDEPPALYDHEWKQHVDGNRDLTHQQWVALGRLENIAARARVRAERGRNMRKRAA